MTSNSACGRSAPISFVDSSDFDKFFNRKFKDFPYLSRRSRSTFEDSDPSNSKSFEEDFAPSSKKETAKDILNKSAPISFHVPSDFDNFFTKKIIDFSPHLPRRSRSIFEDSAPSSSKSFEEHFSPDSSKKKTAKDILNKTKNRLRQETDMFLHSQPDRNSDMFPRKVEDGDDWTYRGFEDMRSRHPIFRMPNWMSEDDDISNLASRMSHSPHFSSMGRRGNPMRERPGSGGVEEDLVDGPNIDRAFLGTNSPNAVRIPIRIEAEAPPGCMPVQPQEQQQQQHQQHQQDQMEQQGPIHSEGPQPAMNQLNKQPQFASKTTSSIDKIDKDNSRNTRCSSAPPDMKDPSQGQRFVSKASIIPQVVGDNKPFSSNQDFNNIPKPFVSSYQPQGSAPIAEEENSNSPSDEQNWQGNLQNQMPQEPYQEMQFPNQSYQQQYQHPQQPLQQETYRDSSDQRSGIVRNIPIIIEGRKERVSSNKDNNATPSRSPPQMQQSSRPPHWNRPVDDPHFGFGSSHGFPSQDNFFNFSSMPHQQQQSYSYEQPNQSTQPNFQQPQKVFTQQPNYQSTQKTPYEQEEPQNQFQQREKTPEPSKDIKMETIAAVRASLTEFQERVDRFEDKEKNKEFLYIDEMLTRALLQLDNIDPDGRDDVRQARRNLIKDINNTISKLEKKASQTSAEKKSDNVMEVDNKTQQENTQSIEDFQNESNTNIITDLPNETKTEELKNEGITATETSSVDSSSKREPSAGTEAQEVGSAGDKMEVESSNKAEDNPSNTIEKSEVNITDSSQPQT